MRQLNNRGQSAVEFAAIIPILFLMFYAILEFSVLYVHDQRVSALSRELANAAFRDCGALEDAELTTCLNSVVDSVLSGADDILPNFNAEGNVMVALYAPDEDLGGNPPPVESLGFQKRGSGGYSSQYSVGDLDADLVNDQGLIAIGEAYYQYSPVTPLQAMIALIMPAELYEATIY